MIPIRVILADDHEMFRCGLKGLLEKERGFKVIAQARDGEELLDCLSKVQSDVVVMDLSMPNLDGLAALREIAGRYPRTKCLVLTMQKDEEHLKRSMANGAVGYILKDSAFDSLVTAIKTVLKGKTYIAAAISDIIAAQHAGSVRETNSPSLEILTKREKEILKLISKGAANKNIAAKLKISIRTVETHRSHLIHKLGLRTTASLVKYAISKGLT